MARAVVAPAPAADVDFYRPTPRERLEYILGQLYGGRVERIDDPRYRFLLPRLTPFQVQFLEWVLDPTAPDRAAVEGGIGCGKTLAIGLVTYVVAQTRPGSLSLVTSDTAGNLMALNWREMQNVFQGEAAWVAGLAPAFTFDNGSVVDMRAYKLHSTQDEAQNPIEGRTVTGVLLIDEAQKIVPKVLDHAEQRTRGTSVDDAGDVYVPKVGVIGRPGAVDWWRKAVQARGGVVFCPRTAENPHNGPRYLDKLREGMTTAEFLNITEGTPLPVKGAAYSAFAYITETGDRAYWPHGNILRAGVAGGPGPVWVALDPGYGSPAVLYIRQVQLLLPAPWTRRQVAVNVVLGGLGLDTVTTPQLIQQVTARLDREGWTPLGLIADPAGAARNAHTGQSDLDLWARPRTWTYDHLGPGLGVRVITTTDPSRRDVLTGISRVSSLMCNAEDPPLRLLCVTEEHWRECEAEGTETRNIRNTILQYTDAIARKKGSTGRDHHSTHIADALRYYVAGAPGVWQGTLPAPSIYTPTPTPHEIAQRQRFEEPR